MAGTWKRLAHTELSSPNATIDTGTFDASTKLHVEVYTQSDSNDHYVYMRYNGDSSSNRYSYQKNVNFEVPDGNANVNIVYHDIYVHTRNGFYVMDIDNQVGKEKLSITRQIGSTSGSTNAPDIREYCGKWVNTSDQITQITIHQGNGSNTFDVGSYITVFGYSDDVTSDEKATLADATGLQDVAVTPSFHYKFSEASGDVVNHGSVASADLTVTSLTRDQSTPSGIGNGMKTTHMNTGYAQNTSRINDYKFMHDGTSKWSATFWLKASGVPTNSDATEKMLFGNIWTDDNGIGFAIRLAKNSDNSSSKARIQTLIADGNSGMPLNDQSADDMMPDTSNWHFYCVTYDPTLSSNNLTVTRDASTSGDGFHQGDEDNDTYSSSNPTRKCVYFARPTSNLDMGIEGTLAQVIIYKDVILTQANKVSLFASGNGTTTLPSVTSEQTVSLAPPVGTRYEEVDTRKIYRFKASTLVNSTYTEDMSDTTGWTFADTGAVNVTGGSLSYALNRNGSNDAASYDFGSTISDTKFILRFSRTPTNHSHSSGSNCIGFFGLSDNTSGQGTSQDFIGFNFASNDNDGCTTKNGTTLVANSVGNHSAKHTSGTKYYEIKRTTGTNVVFTVYNNSDFTGVDWTKTEDSLSSSITSLRYFKWANWHSSGSGSCNVTGTIDDLELWDNVTSAGEPAKWVERGTA